MMQSMGFESIDWKYFLLLFTCKLQDKLELWGFACVVWPVVNNWVHCACCGSYSLAASAKASWLSWLSGNGKTKQEHESFLTKLGLLQAHVHSLLQINISASGWTH